MRIPASESKKRITACDKTICVPKLGVGLAERADTECLTKAYEEVFGQRLRRLQEWTAQQDIPAILHQKIQGLTKKATQFKPTFAYPLAYRTSNQLDRLMNYQELILYSMQLFLWD